MLDTLASQIGAAFVIVVCGFAFLKGDEPERLIAGIFILGWFAAVLLQDSIGLYTGILAVAGIDILMLLALGGIIWKSRKTWPIWACGCQLLIVMSHALMWVDLRPAAASFISIMNLAGYGVLLALAIGTFWSWQERRAAGLE